MEIGLRPHEVKAMRTLKTLLMLSAMFALNGFADEAAQGGAPKEHPVAAEAAPATDKGSEKGAVPAGQQPTETAKKKEKKKK